MHELNTLLAMNTVCCLTQPELAIQAWLLYTYIHTQQARVYTRHIYTCIHSCAHLFRLILPCVNACTYYVILQ